MHQLVFVPGARGGSLPTEEFAPSARPTRLNQTDRTLGAITPYVSLLYGHAQFVQDSVFLSTVQAVGTASRFRQIWREAHRQVRDFRRYDQRDKAGEQVREDFEKLVDNLGNLEFDLAFSVEFSLMRIVSLHPALYDAMDLSEQAKTLSQMFTQLAGSIRSEITAIDIRERQAKESKSKRNALATSFLGFIGVPAMFYLGFLGINAKEVSDKTPMFTWRYLVAYVIAFVLAIFPAVVILPPYIRDWRRASTVDWRQKAR